MHSTGYLRTFTLEHVFLLLEKSALQSTLVVLPLQWCLPWTSKEKDLWMRGGWSHQGEGSCPDHYDSTSSFVNKIKTQVPATYDPSTAQAGTSLSTAGKWGSTVEIHNRCESSQNMIHRLTNTEFCLAWMCNSQRDTCPSFYSTRILQMALQILPHSSAIITSLL